jgi:hypothetical protein
MKDESNTTEQKSGAHSYTESAEVEASVEEKGELKQWRVVSSTRGTSFMVCSDGEKDFFLNDHRSAEHLVNTLNALQSENTRLTERIADLESSREQYAINVLNWSMHRGHTMSDDQRERLEKIVNGYNQSLKESK